MIESSSSRACSSGSSRCSPIKAAPRSPTGSTRVSAWRRRGSARRSMAGPAERIGVGRQPGTTRPRSGPPAPPPPPTGVHAGGGPGRARAAGPPPLTVQWSAARPGSGSEVLLAWTIATSTGGSWARSAGTHGHAGFLVDLELPTTIVVPARLQTRGVTSSMATSSPPAHPCSRTTPTVSRSAVRVSTRPGGVGTVSRPPPEDRRGSWAAGPHADHVGPLRRLPPPRQSRRSPV